MDKTGSTSIRASLARNLDDPQVRYVAPWLENASRCLSAAFRDDPTEFHYFRRLGVKPDDAQRLRNEAQDELRRLLAEDRERTLVMSAEAVSRFGEPDLRRMRAFFREFTDQVTAVGYIRRPKEYMESNLQQQIKSLGPRALNFAALLPEYRARFEHFDSVFGAGEVQYWLFDPPGFAGGDAVLDFCARVGIQFDPKRTIRANDGLSLPALQLLFIYRKFGDAELRGADALRDNDLLVRRLRRLEGPKLRLHSSVVAPVLEHKREGIEWMERRLGQSLKEELAKHDAVAIRSEEDLLQVSAETREWLAQQLPEGTPAAAGDHAKMARQVGYLRAMLARKAAREKAAS